MDVGTSVRALLGRRWVRRGLAVTAALTVGLLGLVAVGASGGLVVRDGEGCPRSVGALGSVSWTDVLHIEGASYEQVDPGPATSAAVEPSQLGDQLGTIRCAIADDVQRPGYDLRDGEATFLEPGTPVHALDGTDAGFRVAAVDDGTPVVYENRSRPTTSGSELLPFPAGDVHTVTFLSAEDGRTVLGQLTDPRSVVSFVGHLQAAPVGERPDLGEEPRVFIALEFDHQPAHTLVAYPGHAITTEGLRLPEAVLDRLPHPAGGPVSTEPAVLTVAARDPFPWVVAVSAGAEGGWCVMALRGTTEIPDPVGQPCAQELVPDDRDISWGGSGIHGSGGPQLSWGFAPAEQVIVELTDGTRHDAEVASGGPVGATLWAVGHAGADLRAVEALADGAVIAGMTVLDRYRVLDIRAMLGWLALLAALLAARRWLMAPRDD